MSNSNSSSPPQFDVATAALEHLELLNRSNVNPLEVAAQFRTLLRSKKARGNNANSKNDNSPPPSSNIDYTYMDYLAADATHRRRARSRGRSDRRSKSLGRIKYDLDEDDDTNNQSGYSHFTQDQSSSNYDPEQSNLRNTIDDTNIYYATSARHGGLITTTNNSTRQYLPESHSCFGLSKWHDEGDSSTEDIYADSAVGSDYSEPPPHFAFASSKAVSCDSAISGSSSHKQYSSSSSEQNQGTPPSSSSLLISPTKQYFANLSQIDESSEQTATFDRSISSSTNNPYPTINWKQLREKQHGHSLDKAKTFVTTTLPRKTISSQVVKPSPNLNTSSPISLLNYHKNQPNFRKRIEQFSTTATNRPSRPRAVTTDLSQALQSSTTMTTSSLTTVSAMSIKTPSDTTESFTYPNVSELRKNFEHKSQKKIPKPIDIATTSTTSTPPLESPLSYAPSIISTGDSRSSSASSSSSSSSSVCKSRCSASSRSSNEIRTPSISPTNSPRPSYTISRLNASSMNNEDVFFPIADCNLVIKHKASGGPKKTGHYNRRPSSPHPHPHSDNSNHLSNSMYSISSGYTEEAHLSGVCNENELMGGSTDDAVYV
ncbi:unnamed protein product [Adineta steineri]|uniref:Uncharacterized protein n=1 Tax=Adineta steineri TaxID=433720 RepID=A0A818KVM5_9BILA|nr:unnamed protein product [Adineta steineri]CAF3562287.1 unnamed protein product [Adineta steineri]